MKSLMIASDIHGSAVYCKKLLECFEKSGAEKLLLLGDILYHGPRNGLCEGYDPKAVADMLNEYASGIICIKGNCDSEVDQMVLGFPIMSETAVILNDGIAALAIHGHKNMDSLPLGGISTVFSGHTHVPDNTVKNGVVYANPGSVSIPKEGSPKGFILWEGRTLNWLSLSGDWYDSREIEMRPKRPHQEDRS